MDSGTGGGRRPRGRPARIGRDQILQAVTCVPDIDSLTMRQLAALLDVSHSALYRWVRDRDALFDLISTALLDRVLEPEIPAGDVRDRLATLARRLREAFLSVPGFAKHLARPHTHSAHPVERLRSCVVGILAEGDISGRAADHCWYIYVTSIVGWLAFEEQQAGLLDDAPSYEDFLGVILRGLPL